MAVGFLWDAQACEDLLASGQADMIALARELLDDPNRVLHAAAKLGVDENHSLSRPIAATLGVMVIALWAVPILRYGYKSIRSCH